MKKIRILFLTLAIMLMLNTMSLAVFADDPVVETAEIEEKTETVSVNPLYEGLIDESVLSLSTDENEGVAFLSEPIYESDEDVIVDTIRSAMENHIVSITVYYQSESELNEECINQWVMKAMEETGIPTQGDYMQYCIGGWACQWSWIEDGNAMKNYNIDIKVTYYTTEEQEAKVSQKISELISGFGFSDTTTDYEKVKIIYDYICKNVTYDYETLNDPSYCLKYTAYAALFDGKAVCQGYASLFYRLLMESGVNSRIISGTSQGKNHAWNIVQIGDRYYNADSTWDAGYLKYSYFLKCDANFNADHIRGEKYATDEFYGVYPMGTDDYESTIKQIRPLSPTQNLKATAAGRQKVKLTWDAVEGAEGYLIYGQKNGKYGYVGMTTRGITFTDTKALDEDYNFYWVFPYVKDDDGKMYPGGCTKYVYAKGICLPVTNLKASSVTGGVKLTWSPSVGADGYLVYGIVNGDSYKYVGMTTQGTVFTDTKASKTVYNYYWVFPYHKNAEGKMIVGGTAKYTYGRAR